MEWSPLKPNISRANVVRTYVDKAFSVMIKMADKGTTYMSYHGLEEYLTEMGDLTPLPNVEHEFVFEFLRRSLELILVKERVVPLDLKGELTLKNMVGSRLNLAPLGDGRVDDRRDKIIKKLLYAIHDHSMRGWPVESYFR